MFKQDGKALMLIIILVFVAIIVVLMMGKKSEAKVDSVEDGSLTVYTNAKVFTVEMPIEHIRAAVCK